MKHKIGPLPLWSWVVIVGGTIGLYLLYRSSQNATASSGTDLTSAQLPDTTGVPGGGGAGDISGAASTDPAVLAALQGITDDLGVLSSQVGTLPGAGGVQDTPPPAQTFAGEVTDVISGINALQQLGSIFTTAPTASSTPTNPAGSGNAAAAGPPKTSKPASWVLLPASAPSIFAQATKIQQQGSTVRRTTAPTHNNTSGSFGSTVKRVTTPPKKTKVSGKR